MKAVFFDLDGTLLPMDLDKYLAEYFGSIVSYRDFGYDDPDKLYKTFLKAIFDSVKNDGSRTNREVYIGAFHDAGLEYNEEKYETYYSTDFERAKAGCRVDPRAKELVEYLRSRSLRLVLATNPLYPATATHARVRWAGLDPDDFEYITVYENSSYAKPNPMYYTDLAEKLGLLPSECLMVGNDTSDDITAADAGMDLFFVTDCLINKNGTDLSRFPHGDLDDLRKYIDSLL